MYGGRKVVPKNNQNIKITKLKGKQGRNCAVIIISQIVLKPRIEKNCIS